MPRPRPRRDYHKQEIEVRMFAKHVCVITLLTVSTLAACAQKPNILLIMVDDMGFSDLGCYGGEIQTPNIDRLASEGVKFSRFYNNFICCPTRASLMTGLSPHLTGIGRMTNPPPGSGYSYDKGVAADAGAKKELWELYNLTEPPNYYEDQVEDGRVPEQFARIWLHSHPGDSSEPICTDENTFATVFGSCDWSVMFIGNFL